MTLRPSSAARQPTDVPTTHAGDQTAAHPAADPATEPSNPHARGTLPLARYLTDPTTEEEIQALAAKAPPMTVDQASRLARLLRLHRRPAGQDYAQAA